MKLWGRGIPPKRVLIRNLGILERNTIEEKYLRMLQNTLKTNFSPDLNKNNEPSQTRLLGLFKKRVISRKLGISAAYFVI